MTKAVEQYFQGDVWIMRLPDGFVFEREGEIAPINGKLILQEGEMTGHHHAIDTLDRYVPEGKSVEDIMNDPKLKSIFEKKDAPVSKMYRSSKVAQDLVSKGYLLRSDLVVGLLEVENGPVKVTHQEHSSITLAPGAYVVGRQIESVAGEERAVAD